MSRDEARAVFKELRKFYPHAKILRDAPALEAYGAILMRYDFAAVMDAARAHVTKSPYFPQVSDLVGGLVPADDAPRSRAWMKKYAAHPADELPSVSRFARQHGLTWQQAAEEMEASKCST